MNPRSTLKSNPLEQMVAMTLNRVSNHPYIWYAQSVRITSLFIQQNFNTNLSKYILFITGNINNIHSSYDWIFIHI